MGRNNRRLLAAAASLLLTGAAAIVQPALAAGTPEGRQRPDRAETAPTAAPAIPAGSVTVSVPSVEATGSNLDDATLKDIASGNVAGHAQELAHLTATSIRIPQVTVTFEAANGGGTALTYTYRDLELGNVKDGVAQSFTVGGMESQDRQGMVLKLGKMTSDVVDIRGILNLYGLLPATSDEMTTIQKDFVLEGGSVAGPDFECSFGETRTAEFKARPLKTSFSDLFGLINAMQSEGKDPSPETLRKFFGFYVDLFQALDTSPSTIANIACDGTSDGQKVKVTMGPISVGSLGGGIYPAVEVKNLAIDGGKNGSFSLGSITMKSIDLNGPIKLLLDPATTYTPDWFTAHARDLIPAFGGFAFSDLKMDVPDEEAPPARVKATIGDFDLSLADYFGGIPTTITSAVHHLAFDLPPAPAGEDDPLAEARAMGIKSLDLGFDLGLHRDAANQSIILDKLALNGVNLGNANLTGVVGNAGDGLFASDQATVMKAATALTLKSLKLDLTDEGLADLLFKQMAPQMKLSPPAARVAAAATAQQAIVEILGGSPEAAKVAETVGRFINGGKSLSVTATAKAPAGVGLFDFMAAQSDPKLLVDKVSIEATGQ